MAYTMTSPLAYRDEFEIFARGLRVVAWLWIAGVAVAYAARLDLASVLAVELSSVVAFELLLELAGVTALAVGPGSIGLALSFVIERISYLTAELNFF